MGRQRQGAGLTGHEVAETDGGDGDEGVVEALDVVPLLCHHEHEGWDHQVDQHAPQDEDGRARDLRLALRGKGRETKSDGGGDRGEPSRAPRGPRRQPEVRPVGRQAWEAHCPGEGGGGDAPSLTQEGSRL